jgi:hypothetical protein
MINRNFKFIQLTEAGGIHTVANIGRCLTVE